LAYTEASQRDKDRVDLSSVPWVRAKLRGQTVFARCDDAGRLSASGGRVEVRYKPNDGRRYQAAATNLSGLDGTVLPDDFCGPAEAPAPRPERRGAGGATSKGRSASTDAGAPPPVTSDGSSLVAYTDGACSGNPGPAGLGVVLLDGSERLEIGEFLGTGTNNVAELTAILRALEATEGADKPLVIHTDSKYSIGVLTKGWKAKANVELIGRIRALLTSRSGIRFVYVPGHAGVPLNERADELARAAILTAKTTRQRTDGAP
jgi:ribonuclease HI